MSEEEQAVDAIGWLIDHAQRHAGAVELWAENGGVCVSIVDDNGAQVAGAFRVSLDTALSAIAALTALRKDLED